MLVETPWAVYNHCTGNKGKCPDKYAREEKVDEQFVQSLKQIKIDDDVLNWVVSVMSESTADNRKQRDAQVVALAQQKQRLEDRIGKMYEDKLDGIISDEEYARLSKKYRGDLTDLKFRREQLGAEKEDTIDSSKHLLELAQKAASLYSAQISSEKRKLLNLVYSNASWAGGELAANFNKPFYTVVSQR